ncbi:coadhesin-like [Sycon ciliatum]|uniref:coadhesin-like n=1 Tax=Sycon ciliatum TaxID=27933 RepID=UPI0020A9D046|eukprot:scpid89705/ scgid30293/ 
MAVLHPIIPATILLGVMSTIVMAGPSDPSGPNTCNYTATGVENRVKKHYRSCGWWGRSRCVRHNTNYKVYSVVHRKRCCTGARQSGNQCVLDCLVTKWGSWSSCSDSCNPGTRRRYRCVTRPADRGTACPPEHETKPCNAGRKHCNIETKCWADGYVNASLCGYCDAGIATRNAWQDQSGAKCDDKNRCTKDDTCRRGVCKGKPLSCLSCESCKDTRCVVTKGFCQIHGHCYQHGDPNPTNSRCQYCHNPKRPHTVKGIVRHRPNVWTNRRVGTKCSRNGHVCLANGRCGRPAGK